MSSPDPRNRWRWACYLLGGAAAAYGLVFLVVDLLGTALLGWAAFVLAGVTLHDLVLAPLAALVGLGIGRLLPGRLRPAVTVGLLVAAMTTAVAWPFVLGLGQNPDNPSALPLDYGRGLVVILVMVALATAAACLRTALSRRRRPGATE